MTTASTLVETVSINYEDFNENFLTCGTCLCTYDGQEHTPKLLTCSHTVCRGCLERIAAGTGVRDAGSFRCPICRETIPLPRGGVAALPPSFLVNQLLDLMARQRKEVIPKCSVHSAQELLFCESCDSVFCTLCSGNGNSTHGTTTSGSGEHTVIPFSVAIKRMSEILLYKAHLCINKLNRAAEIINAEIQKLDQNVEHTLDLVNHSIQEVITLLDKRRQELLEEVTTLRDKKKKILQEQLKIIETEKENVQGQCNGLEYQVEVRNITNKISDLNEKIDSVSNLMEPRENAFIKYEYTHNFAFQDIQKSLDNFGSVRSSKTFPPLCSATVGNASAFIENSAIVRTIDYHGDVQKQGGDPVLIAIKHKDGANVSALVIDNDDGTYDIRYVPERPGQYELHVNIFDRPIKNSPFIFSTSEHINPVSIFGSRGSDNNKFVQPVSVVIDKHQKVYVLDTGNSRIKVLNSKLEFVKHITNKAFEGRGGIGLALCPSSQNLMIVNWRNKEISRMTQNGELIKQHTDAVLKEPICIAVNRAGEVIIADNSHNGVVIFNPSVTSYRCLGWKGNHTGRFDLISCIAIGQNDELIVADSIIHIFSPSGTLLREVYPEGRGRGRYGGICIDSNGNLLATRSDKSRSYIQVFDYASGNLKFCIDSHNAKLKRPSGIAILDDHHLLVVDLGNDCIKKFRYR